MKSGRWICCAAAFLLTAPCAMAQSGWVSVRPVTVQQRVSDESGAALPGGIFKSTEFGAFVTDGAEAAATPAAEAQSDTAQSDKARAAQPDAAAGGAQCPCCGCWCRQCECPQKPAPCQPCPHVSTVSPYWNVNIFGAMQANMYFSTARPIAPAFPLFLAPDSAEPENTVDVFARPSNIGAIFTGPDVGQWKTGGMAWLLFYNDALIVDRYGILPFQAWGEIKNEDWRIAAGLQFNVFCPNAPNMLAFSMLIASGDAGNNFPGQFRIERFLHPSDDSQWTLQFALSDPIATSVASSTPLSQIINGTPALRATEDNGWPNLEARIAYAVGELKQEGLVAKRPFELGASVVGGQLRSVLVPQPNVVADIFGAGGDYYWRITDRLGVQGEAFVGQTLGFLNGGILQNVNSVTFEPIRSRGGWGEVYYYLTPCVHTHWGGGIDDPIDRDLAASQISRNETLFANLIWDITKQLRVGFEFSWRKTDYAALPDNEGTGYYSQIQWSF